jgi:prevent-host-death family protein
MRRIAIAKAKDQLTRLIHEAEKGSGVELTRHGHPVAVLLSVREYERARGGKRDFANQVRQFREDNRDDLLREREWDADALRDRSPGR